MHHPSEWGNAHRRVHTTILPALPAALWSVTIVMSVGMFTVRLLQQSAALGMASHFWVRARSRLSVWDWLSGHAVAVNDPIEDEFHVDAVVGYSPEQNPVDGQVMKHNLPYERYSV
jgi:hypothetical protein